MMDSLEAEDTSVVVTGVSREVWLGLRLRRGRIPDDSKSSVRANVQVPKYIIALRRNSMPTSKATAGSSGPGRRKVLPSGRCAISFNTASSLSRLIRDNSRTSVDSIRKGNVCHWLCYAYSFLCLYDCMWSDWAYYLALFCVCLMLLLSWCSGGWVCWTNFRSRGEINENWIQPWIGFHLLK